MQLNLLSEEFDQADSLLNRIVMIDIPNGKGMEIELADFLARHYKHLEAVKKSSFGQLQIGSAVSSRGRRGYKTSAIELCIKVASHPSLDAH